MNLQQMMEIYYDFIHYSIEDEAIREFIKKLNCMQIYHKMRNKDDSNCHM